MNLNIKIMEKEKLTNENSLKIITEMIETAKCNVRDNGFFFRLWGWLVILGCLGHFSLLKFTEYEHPYIAWGIIIIGLIWSPIHGIKLSKNEKVKTHIDSLHGYVWMVFFINYIIIVVFMSKLNYFICGPILMLVAGAVFLTGILIKYTPLIFSAVFIWLMAILCFFLDYEYQLIITAVACAGYLVPGYMLMAKYKKENV